MSHDPNVGTYMGSFLSEHTAEFVLAPRAAEVFSSYAAAAIPIYYWASREGSRLALESSPDTHIRVVSIFARRPKVERTVPDRITAKLNAQLFRYSVAAEAVGIPTLAGFPLVASLRELRQTCRCMWFRLHGASVMDVEILMDLEGQCIEPRQIRELTGPTELEALADDVVQAAAILEWGNALEALRQLRWVEPDHGYMTFRGGYKPFQVLLLQ